MRERERGQERKTRKGWEGREDGAQRAQTGRRRGSRGKRQARGATGVLPDRQQREEQQLAEEGRAWSGPDSPFAEGRNKPTHSEIAAGRFFCFFGGEKKGAKDKGGGIDRAHTREQGVKETAALAKSWRT